MNNFLGHYLTFALNGDQWSIISIIDSFYEGLEVSISLFNTENIARLLLDVKVSAYGIN